MLLNWQINFLDNISFNSTQNLDSKRYMALLISPRKSSVSSNKTIFHYISLLDIFLVLITRSLRLDQLRNSVGRDSVSAGAMSGHGASTSLVSVTWPVSRQLIGHITAARTTATNVFPFRCCLSSLLRSPRVSTESARTPGLSGSTYPCCPSQSLVCKSWCVRQWS